MGAETFPENELVAGSVTTAGQCAALPHAVWIGPEDDRHCLRYYPVLAESGAEVIVYLHGDVLLSDPTGRIFPIGSYGRRSPDELAAEAASLAGQAGKPAIVLARPGTHGSSGDHNDRRTLREVQLVDKALDAIKARHGFSVVHLAGQSGGGHLVAALINRRKDVGCAVMSSAVASVKTMLALRRLTHRLDPRRFHDPAEHVHAITQDPPPTIIVLSDTRDRVVPYASQSHYVESLRKSGIALTHIVLDAPDKRRHGLADQAKKAVSLCAQGRSVTLNPSDAIRPQQPGRP